MMNVHFTPDARYKFTIREDSPPIVSDGCLVRESWVQNVYQLSEDDFKDTGIMVDLGANIGVVTTRAISLGATVIAVEPEPENLRLLDQNLRDNGVRAKAEIYPVAVHKESMSTGGHIAPLRGNGNLVFEEEETTTPVEVYSLADFYELAGISYIDVLKIDIEGSEYPLIEGADVDTLRRARYITLEFNGCPSPVDFGQMVYKMCCYGNTHVLGSPDRGGYIYSRRYDNDKS